MNLPELFLKLLNMSISASWLVLAVVLLRLIMKKAPKWMTCALWAMVALRLVMPFSIESMFSLLPSTQTLPPEIITGNRFEIDSGIPAIDHQINDVVLDNYYEGVTVPVDSGFNFMSAASIIWLIGMALLVLYTIGSYLHLRHKVSASVRLRDNIYLCDYIETPFILGVLRPKIYLPSSLDQAQWPHVIAHEQAHLKRRDHWWKPLGFLLLCIHWFNPLLWLAYILLCRDIELACDEKVIRELGDQGKKAYSEALLECSMPRYLIAACPLAFGEVGVKDRVKSILNYKKPAFWVILIALVLCVTVAVCFLTDPLGSRSISTGIYTLDQDLYKAEVSDGSSDGNTIPTIPAGVYQLDQNNSLFHHADGQINAVGAMEEYRLSNRELSRYLAREDGWQVPNHSLASVSSSLWLRQEDQSFYLFFKTTDGNTYLARGWEDYSERNTDSDDTRITHLCQIIHQPDAIQESMTYLAGTVTEVHASAFLLQTDENALIPYRVSLYKHLYDAVTNTAALGIMPAPEVGDRVLVTFDGNIVRQNGESYIPNVFGVRVLEGSGINCTALSANDEVTPLVLPKNTDIATVTQQIPILKLHPDNNRQFTVLYDDIELRSFRLYDYRTREEIKGFSSLLDGTNWDLLVPGRNYIVTADYNGLLCFAVSVPHDFGITLTARNASSIGVTIDCVQSGGTCPGPFMYGEYYRLERYTGEKWVEVPNLDGSHGGTFFTMAYALHQNDSTSWRFDWQSRYGELAPGQYRLVRYFDYGHPLSEDYHYLPFYAEFSIAETADPLDCYRDLPTDKGLELYALENGGYVLMSGTNRNKTEEEITSLTPTSAEQMKTVLAEYGIPPESVFIYNRTTRSESSIREDLGIPLATNPECDISMELLGATGSEGVVMVRIQNLGDGSVRAGYEYHLEILTEDGWVHYGYPPEELAWEAAIQFGFSGSKPETSEDAVIFEENWNRVADAPLPPGTYRYCKSIIMENNGKTTHVTRYAEFTVVADTMANQGLLLEVKNATPEGATLSLTYHGGHVGQLMADDSYHLMIQTPEGGFTRYGLSLSEVSWGDAQYPLQSGESILLTVQWDKVAGSPLPSGTYQIVKLIQKQVPYGNSYFELPESVVTEFTVP